MTKRSLGRGTVLLGIFLAAAACEGRERNAGRDQSMAAGAEARPDTGAPGAGGAPSAAAKGGLTDSNIVAILDELNKADSAAGAVALKKASRADVKEYARLMMSEHHGLRLEGEELARRLGIEPKLPERDPLAPYVRNEAAELKKAPRGPEFDQTYIDHEVSVHQAAIDFANQAKVITQTPELKQYIEKALPALRKHLEQAQSIQKQLAPAA